MTTLHEYRLLTHSGQEVVSFAYCEPHWHTSGERDYRADVGKKQHRLFRLPVDEARRMCTICREES